jgi:hypothetical protein
MNSIKHSEIAPGDIVQPTGGMDGGMTRDDIQRMAIEAGFSVYDMHDVDGQDLISVEADDLGVLERFISLVAKETTSLCGTGAICCYHAARIDALEEEIELLRAQLKAGA